MANTAPSNPDRIRFYGEGKHIPINYFRPPYNNLPQGNWSVSDNYSYGFAPVPIVDDNGNLLMGRPSRLYQPYLDILFYEWNYMLEAICCCAYYTYFDRVSPTDKRSREELIRYCMENVYPYMQVNRVVLKNCAKYGQGSGYVIDITFEPPIDYSGRVFYAMLQAWPYVPYNDPNRPKYMDFSYSLDFVCEDDSRFRDRHC